MVATSIDIDPLSKRVAHFRKLFAKGLGRKATPLQAAALNNAAVLTARAEAAGLDPSVSLNDCVRINGAAAKARRDMEALLAKRRPDDDTTALDQYFEASS